MTRVTRMVKAPRQPLEATPFVPRPILPPTKGGTAADTTTISVTASPAASGTPAASPTPAPAQVAAAPKTAVTEAPETDAAPRKTDAAAPTAADTSAPADGKKKRHRFKKGKPAVEADGAADGALRAAKPAASSGSVHPSRQEPMNAPATAAATAADAAREAADAGGKRPRFEDRTDARREARREERRAAMTCFQCRGTGHGIADCPKTQAAREADAADAVGSLIAKPTGAMCYKCGSLAHSVHQCKKPTDQNNPYPYAECFVCGLRGHLASKCPKNPRGLYPNGGGCRYCASTQHLARDCRPDKVDVGKTVIGVVTANANPEEDDLFGALREQAAERQAAAAAKRQAKPVGPKRVKF